MTAAALLCLFSKSHLPLAAKGGFLRAYLAPSPFLPVLSDSHNSYMTLSPQFPEGVSDPAHTPAPNFQSIHLICLSMISTVPGVNCKLVSLSSELQGSLTPTPYTLLTQNSPGHELHKCRGALWRTCALCMCWSLSLPFVATVLSAHWAMRSWQWVPRSIGGMSKDMSAGMSRSCVFHTPSHLSMLGTVLTLSGTSHVWVPGWLKGPVCAATAYISLVLTVWL